MKKQKVKITYDKNDIFFFDHSFKTALEYADYFIKRNKGKFEMNIFLLNESNYGKRWTFFKKVIKH